MFHKFVQNSPDEFAEWLIMISIDFVRKNLICNESMYNGKTIKDNCDSNNNNNYCDDNK